jgi:hypothetical protein
MAEGVTKRMSYAAGYLLFYCAVNRYHDNIAMISSSIFVASLFFNPLFFPQAN